MSLVTFLSFRNLSLTWPSIDGFCVGFSFGWRPTISHADFCFCFVLADALVLKLVEMSRTYTDTVSFIGWIMPIQSGIPFSSWASLTSDNDGEYLTDERQGSDWLGRPTSHEKKRSSYCQGRNWILFVYWNNWTRFEIGRQIEMCPLVMTSSSVLVGKRQSGQFALHITSPKRQHVPLLNICKFRSSFHFN